jgi:hypothetical protein
MPYFLVPITGDPDRAAGLLTKAGIESVGRFAGDRDPAQRASLRLMAARLSAESAELARERVRAAVGEGRSRAESRSTSPAARSAAGEAASSSAPPAESIGAPITLHWRCAFIGDLG